MFCSIKNDKKNNSYKCYLCDRTRDKATGKVKSSDKYIMTLQYEDLLKSEAQLINSVKDIFINKSLNINNANIVIEKIMKLKNVVVNNDNTTRIIEAEIVEECVPTYDTTIMFDVKQDYIRNIKDSLNLNKMSSALGGKSKDKFEIMEEELKKVHENAKHINKRIDEILEEELKIKAINNSFKDLESDIRLIQDIYISCYNKMPTSEIWLIGNGYIRGVYELDYIILPGEGKLLFDNWEELKEMDHLDDTKAYFNKEDHLEEIELHNNAIIDIDKNDITGSLIRLMLSGNYEVDYTMSDYIDIIIDNQSVSLSIDHLIDWINNKPIKDYKVTIEALKQYKEQLYKYKNIN